MNVDFKDIMSKRTDEELIKIVTVDKNDYQPLAIIAAEEEIENRKLDTVKIEQVESEFKAEIEDKKQLNAQIVSSFIRFIHFSIDTIVWLIITAILIIPLSLLSLPLIDNESDRLSLIGYLFFILTFFCYYYIMEVNYQKTVAKFITKTKIVTNNGNKPTKGDILKRTICRLIPFEQISFLFTRNGLHDSLSDTIVIEPEEIRVEKGINERDGKKNLFRIFAYPVCIFMILYGFFTIMQPLTISKSISAIGAISIASIYLYADITILKTKNKEKE